MGAKDDVDVKARFGDFVFDSKALELRKGDALVDLQPKVLNFLGVLLENEGRTVAQRELLDRIWPGVVVGLDSLTRVASLARRALDDGAEKRLLETRRGAGWAIGSVFPLRFWTPTKKRHAPKSLHGGNALVRARSLFCPSKISGQMTMTPTLPTG